MRDFYQDIEEPKPADDESAEPVQRFSSLSSLGAGTDIDTQRVQDNARSPDPLADLVRRR